jgi:hypothetical protein
MIRLYAAALFSILVISYGEITSVLPSNDLGVEEDWIGFGLISIFFLLLFALYKNSKNKVLEYEQSRQREEVDTELKN